MSGDWQARSGTGGPGPAGCIWEAANIDFITDPVDTGNTLMVLTATTDGTGAGSSQAQMTTSTRFLEGTYAARVRFTDTPESGTPDGDQVVETFYAITPWSMAAQEAYSEIDFEYLANGGWGTSEPTLFETTWELAEPVTNDHSSQGGALEGWHLLVVTVVEGEVRYSVDGMPVATHAGIYYPESPMSINFNLWFIADGFAAGSVVRSWRQDVDWVYHARGRALSTSEVQFRVDELRDSGTAALDTVQ